jgi:hypothetical protein
MIADHLSLSLTAFILAAWIIPGFYFALRMCGL